MFTSAAQARSASIDIDHLYRSYAEAVYRRCLRLSRDKVHAMDLVHETFLRAHKYQRGYRAEAKPISWLFAICDRCFFDSCKKNAPLASDEIEAFVEEEEEGADVVFCRHDLVSKLLSRSPRDVQQIVVHRYFDELDNHQIAERLEINEKTVRRKLEKFLVNARKFARSR